MKSIDVNINKCKKEIHRLRGPIVQEYLRFEKNSRVAS
jgi:hypothetical protein